MVVKQTYIVRNGVEEKIILCIMHNIASIYLSVFTNGEMIALKMAQKFVFFFFCPLCVYVYLTAMTH